MGFVLHKLNLTDAQKTQIKGIFAGEKSQFEALRASVKANREALATTAPSSPEYPALVQQAQTNATQRIKLETETWSADPRQACSPRRSRIRFPGSSPPRRAQREAEDGCLEGAAPAAVGARRRRLMRRLSALVRADAVFLQ